MERGQTLQQIMYERLDSHMKKNEFYILNTNQLKKMDCRLRFNSRSIKLLEENKEKILDIGVGNDFVNMAPKVQTTKAIINKWDNIKL